MPSALPNASLIDQAIDNAIAEHRIVGTVVIAMKDGELVYRRAAGLADREAAKELKADDIFPLASITKPIVAAAVLALAEQGRLSLQDPVTKWLPYFRPKLQDGTEPVITLHHLLTHTSGLAYGFFLPDDGPYRKLGISDGLELSGLSLEENLHRLAAAPLFFTPGENWQYSLGSDVLGAVIAEAAAKPFPDAIRDLITAPLDMPDTAFQVTEIDRFVTAYADGNPEPVRMTEGYTIPTGENAFVKFSPTRALNPNEYPSGGAGMSGTADDIARFLETIRSGGAPILKPESIELAFQDHVTTDTLKPATQGPGWGFGYFGAVLGDPEAAGSPQSKGTVQWGGAYGHSWFIDPKQNLTVVALTNTTFEGMWGAFRTQIRDAVSQALNAS